MPAALILIADGTEEMEFTITYDILVRAGVDTTSAFVPNLLSATGAESGFDPLAAKGSRGIYIVPDICFELSLCGPDKYDLLVIPGGAQGAETMSKHPSVQELVRRYLDKGNLVGMICAGSLTALTAKLPSQPLTSHPSVRSLLENGFEYSEESVVVSNNLVTSRGPGTAFPFALTLVELLCGRGKREEIRGPMVFPPNTPF